MKFHRIYHPNGRFLSTDGKRFDLLVLDRRYRWKLMLQRRLHRFIKRASEVKFEGEAIMTRRESFRLQEREYGRGRSRMPFARFVETVERDARPPRPILVAELEELIRNLGPTQLLEVIQRQRELREAASRVGPLPSIDPI